MDDNQDEESKPAFRIRFTISSCSTSRDHSQNNICHEEIHHSPNPLEENEKQSCNCKSDANLDRKNPSCRNHSKKSFKFIQPQNHKSSLFVSLSDTSRNSSPQQGEHNHLFVSPDLDQYIPASPPSPADSALSYSSPDLFESGTDPSVSEVESSTRSSDDNTMSHSCNFINWSSAARNRSKSVTRSNSPQLMHTDNSGRRASSSNDLAAPANPLANKSVSGNHLAVNASSETICDQTTTNRQATNNHGHYLKHSQISLMQPSEIQIDVPERCIQPDALNYPMFVDEAIRPISLDDIMRVDMESLRLEEECRMLESQVQRWEERVDQLERERFRRTSPRSLIDKLIQKRKYIRELDFQLFKLNLEAQDSDSLYRKLSPLADNENQIQSYKDSFQIIENKKLETNLAAGKYGSQIKPGQENTADILDAIPPSGQLQHKQYLTKTTSGTDYSDYSRSPIDSRHRHFLPRRNSRHNTHGPHNESQAYVQLDKSKRFSPVRPDHFKGDFLPNHVIVSEDSSSPASGDNP